jgi:hypothetical protein
MTLTRRQGFEDKFEVWSPSSSHHVEHYAQEKDEVER